MPCIWYEKEDINIYKEFSLSDHYRVNIDKTTSTKHACLVISL